MRSESALSVRFGQLAWRQTVTNIAAVHERFRWEHPMDGDYLAKSGIQALSTRAL